MPASRVQTILAYLMVGLLILTVLGFLGAMFHVFSGGEGFFAAPIFASAFVLPLVCLPLAILCLLGVVGISAWQKSRARAER